MSASVKLYELVGMRDVLDEWLAETEGEVTPELAQLLDALEGDTKEKIERIALFIREQLATCTAIDEEIKRLGLRTAARKRAAEGLKAYLKSQMERLELKKVEGLLATVAIQNNPPAVKTPLEPEQLYAIPNAREYVRRVEKVEYTLARDLVLAAWKAGVPLPEGLSVEVNSHIRIR